MSGPSRSSSRGRRPERKTNAPKKRLGQHLLHDEGVLAKIVSSARLAPGDIVLEIGAGQGSLTRHLARAVTEAGQVIAVELDADLIPTLNALADEFPQVYPVQTDILDLNLASFLAENAIESPVSVVGNLPYYITTPILEWLIENRRLWTRATIMVQEEVARRLVASPGEPGCGAISVFLHFYCAVRLRFSVGAGAFRPPPQVRSAVLELSPRERPAVSVADERWFFRVVRAAFGQRRKTVRNALRTLGPDVTRDDIREAIDRVGIDGGRRGETFHLDEFAALADALWARRPHS